MHVCLILVRERAKKYMAESIFNKAKNNETFPDFFPK